VFTPPGAPAGGEPTIRFEPTQPGLSLLARSGETVVYGLQRFRRSWWTTARVAGLYAPICRDACVTRVPRGQYRFALALDDGAPVPLAPVNIEQPSTLRAEYIDRSGYRTAGAVVGIGGILTGIVMVAASLTTGHGDDHVNGPLMGGGIAVIATSAILGSILGLQKDQARMVVSPGN